MGSLRFAIPPLAASLKYPALSFFFAAKYLRHFIRLKLKLQYLRIEVGILYFDRMSDLVLRTNSLVLVLNLRVDQFYHLELQDCALLFECLHCAS